MLLISELANELETQRCSASARFNRGAPCREFPASAKILSARVLSARWARGAVRTCLTTCSPTLPRMSFMTGPRSWLPG